MSSLIKWRTFIIRKHTVSNKCPAFKFATNINFTAAKEQTDDHVHDRQYEGYCRLKQRQKRIMVKLYINISVFKTYEHQMPTRKNVLNDP
jgi:hypothetical protein